MSQVRIHECEAFNDKDDKGKPVKGTFDQARWDNQFPGKGVPVMNHFDKKTRTWDENFVCTFCGKDVSKADKATPEQRKYLEGKA